MFPPTEVISNSLGLVSSAAWLGAQFPQLWTNYKLQSAEGLALPFLANWLAGDLTNLVGCILTNQLPFQTYLAAYFVWVDFCLLSQYIYYEWYRSPRAKPKLEIDTTGGAPPLTASPIIYPSGSTCSLPPNSYRPRLHTYSSSRQPLPLPDDIHDETGGDDHVVMTESMCSEHRRGAPLAGRGRAFDRPNADVDHDEDHRRRVSQTKGRGASLVFLAVFGLWGIGMRGRQGGVAESGVERVGRVFPRQALNTVHPSIYFDPSSKDVVQLQYVSLASTQSGEEPDRLPPTTPPPAPPPSDDEPDRTSWTWVIGRISAWACTSLYLTSRMPQIWKNYSRQSVEGLSISLFVFAFLGNFFYVCSVLTVPQMFGTPGQRAQYLKDCLPYLLGSGGTFTFDIAIIVQSFVYRGLHPTKSTGGKPRRRYSVARGTEQDALLGHSRRSHSIDWVRRSPSMARSRASLDRYNRNRASLDIQSKAQPNTERTGRSGYGATQSNMHGHVGV